jgi:hypothetical protein
VCLREKTSLRSHGCVALDNSRHRAGLSAFLLEEQLHMFWLGLVPIEYQFGRLFTRLECLLSLVHSLTDPEVIGAIHVRILIYCRDVAVSSKPTRG